MEISKIVLNIPHSSIEGIGDNKYGKWGDYRGLLEEVKEWTDWHTDKLFIPPSSLSDKVMVKRFDKSRFVVDVERLPNDILGQLGQGIIYTRFNGYMRYIDETQKTMLMKMYDDYIKGFDNLIDNHTILVDCHSFPSKLSDNDICIGYNDDWSKPSSDMLIKIKDVFTSFGFSVEFNTPYGNSLTPVEQERDYKSIMIEINKRVYMDEKTLMLTPTWYKIKWAIDKMYHTILNG